MNRSQALLATFAVLAAGVFLALLSAIAGPLVGNRAAGRIGPAAAAGAALMTGTRQEARFIAGVHPLIFNRPLQRALGQRV